MGAGSILNTYKPFSEHLDGALICNFQLPIWQDPYRQFRIHFLRHSQFEALLPSPALPKMEHTRQDTNTEYKF